MSWKSCGNQDPHMTCMICGHSGSSIEVYEQVKRDQLKQKRYWQECNQCSSAAKFYQDETLDEYFYQVFRLVKIEEFEELVKMAQENESIN